MQFLAIVFFDFGFKTFITSTLIKIIYALAVLLTVIGYLFALIATANNGGSVPAVLIVGALAALLYLCFTRVALECLIVFFRIYEDIHQMAGGEDIHQMVGGRPGQVSAGLGEAPLPQ